MLPLSAAIFFTSGFAALLYQVIWQRLLVLFSGADLYSVTIIVASFMGGMGVGHLAGGHVADRVKPRTALLCFAGAELAIALFGFFSRSFYYDFLYTRVGGAPMAPAALALLLFASLLWPTFFMGASLPLLSRALASRIERASSVIGMLYGVNTLGAAAGALLSTWVFLPRLGLEGSLRVGVLLNVGCAVALLPAVVFFTRARGAAVVSLPDTAHKAAGVTAVHEGEETFSFGGWALIFACSGLLALALEIVWFRVLSVTMKPTSFTFGTMLGMYLTGVAAGALAGSAAAPRIPRPAAVFLGLQAGVGASATLLLTAYIRLVDNIPPLWAYVGGYEPLDVRDAIPALRMFLGGNAPTHVDVGATWTFLMLYVAVPSVLVLPPTFLMGFSFPVLQRVVQTNLSRIGRRVGMLLVTNVAGSMLGTVLTGWLLLDRVGTAGTIRILAGLSSLFAVACVFLALRGSSWPGARRLAAGPTPVLVAAAIFVPLQMVMPSTATLWAHLHGTIVEQMTYAEDGSGVSVANTDGKNAILFGNGIGMGPLPYGDLHTALGALPAFIHPAPRTAVVIGLGSGDTLHAVAGRRDLQRITCVEIIRGELAALAALRMRLPYEGLTDLLDDSRIDQVFGDGRIFLRRGGAYDIVEADALRPRSAYSGTLYSDAYFGLLRDHLAPNGLAATWAPTQRVYNTFIRSFPYVIAMPGVLIGSNQPIPFDRTAIAARLADPAARGYFSRAGIDIERLLAPYLANPAVYDPGYPRAQLADINTDLFPKDEFDLSPRP